MNPFTLNKKHIFITGASSGIGRQCAISCSKMGANITLVGRNIERLNETLKEMKGNSHEIIIQDITDISKIEPIINKSVDKLNKINGFIHAAGIEITLPLKLHKTDIFQKQMLVNVFAGFEIARILSLKKNTENSASFVFISSIMGILGQAGQVAYCSSKGALVSGVKALAVELSRREIRVNTVAPGQVEGTNMTKKMMDEFSSESLAENKKAHLLGWLNPEDIANACVFLLSDASRKITGTNLIIDSGYSAK